MLTSPWLFEPLILSLKSPISSASDIEAIVIFVSYLERTHYGLDHHKNSPLVASLVPEEPAFMVVILAASVLSADDATGK